EKEWEDFLKNVEEFGIRKPLDVTKDYKILDGRHRAKAAKKLGIETVEVTIHDLTEQEIIRWVRDISIEQKILSPAQKHKIFTEEEDFMKNLYEEGKEKIDEGRKNSHKSRKGNLAKSQGPKPKHNTNDEIGKMIGVSGTTVKRLNAVKKKDPELYEEVIKGKESARSAYTKLHPPRNKVSEENDTVNKTKKTKNNLYNFKNENLSKEEEEKLLLDSKNETLKSHLKQLKLFIESNDNLEEIISLNPKDESVYYEYSQVLEVIQRKINKNNRSVDRKSTRLNSSHV